VPLLEINNSKYNTMKKALLLFIVLLTGLALTAQVPQGFNYQAIARDISGNPITGQNLQVKLAVMADSVAVGGTVYWEEVFNPVPTNAFGLLTVVMGRGTRQATSTVATFSAINWTVTPVYIRTYIFYSGSWKFMGITRLWSVPYALTADDINGALSKLKITATAVATPDTALFEVKNNAGQTVFAVYPEGVRVYVSDGVKGSGTKGGFAIGGFGSKATSQPYFIVNQDSIRAYVDSTAMKGNNKGGFAVGGFGGAKGYTNLNLFYLSKKNYFIGHQSGINTTTGLYNSFFGYQAGMPDLIAQIPIMS